MTTTDKKNTLSETEQQTVIQTYYQALQKLVQQMKEYRAGKMDTQEVKQHMQECEEQLHQLSMKMHATQLADELPSPTPTAEAKEDKAVKPAARTEVQETQTNYQRLTRYIESGRLLRQGAKGEEVKELQQRINKMGVGVTLVEDGNFGPKTNQAVKAFQRQQGLKVDGVVGSQTLAALQRKTPTPTSTTTPTKPESTQKTTSKTTPKNTPTATAKEDKAVKPAARTEVQETQTNYQRLTRYIESGRLLRQGAKGEEVKELQQRINRMGVGVTLVEDGNFGPKTNQAVKAFQRQQGLKVDGVVGSQTLAALQRKTHTSQPRRSNQPATQRLESPKRYLEETDIRETLFRRVKSRPEERSANNTTLCSKTARLNARDVFGVGVPQGNAKAAVESSPRDRTYQHSLDYRQQKRGPGFSSIQQTLNQLTRNRKVNMCDVSVKSRSRHGHRVILFRSEHDGRWYVLDPYRGKRFVRDTRDPKPAEQYFADANNKPLLLRCYAAPTRIV